MRVVDGGSEDPALETLGRWAASLGDRLGLEVLREIAEFSKDAGPGAMLTIRHTRDGFTAQVTGAIVGGPPMPLTSEVIEELMRKLG